MYIDAKLNNNNMLNALKKLSEIEAQRSHQALYNALDSKKPLPYDKNNNPILNLHHPTKNAVMEAGYQSLNPKKGIPPISPYPQTSGKNQPHDHENGKQQEHKNSTQDESAYQSKLLKAQSQKEVDDKLNKDQAKAKNYSLNTNASTNTSTSTNLNHNHETYAKTSDLNSLESLPHTLYSHSINFNTLGNLTHELNPLDFKLIQKPQEIFNPNLYILSHAHDKIYPYNVNLSLSLQITLALSLYNLLVLLQSKIQNLSLLNPQLYNQDENILLNYQAQVLAPVFMFSFFKMFEPNLNKINLSRFFKKGPLGKNKHTQDTDDDKAQHYIEDDGEKDYIKRPRTNKTNMNFHYALFT